MVGFKRLAGIGLIFLAGCATKDHADPEAFYFDSAWNDKNRAPASLEPSVKFDKSNPQIDPLYMRVKADFHFTKGESFSLEGRHQDAIEEFRSVLIYDPDSVKVRNRLAAEYVKFGLLSEGLKTAIEVQRENPQNIEALITLAGIYTSLKDYPRALEFYDKAIKLNPNHVEALTYSAAVLSEMKSFDLALKRFQALADLEDYPYPHRAYYYMGRVREDQGTLATSRDAIEYYKKSIQLKPSHSESVLALSSLFMRLKQDEEAIRLLATFQKEQGPSARIADILASLYLKAERYDLALEQFAILETDPDEALNAKMKAALILIDQKKFELAQLKLEKVLEFAPDSDKVLFYLSAVYEETRQFEKAVVSFTKIVPTSSFYIDSITHASYLLKNLGKSGDAIELVEKALEFRPDAEQLIPVYASLVETNEKAIIARTKLENLVQKFPENISMQFFLATILDQLGEKKKAVERMEMVLEKSPNHPQAMNYLAYHFAETGQRLDEAKALAMKAAILDPADPYIVDTYGWVLYKMGDFLRAIQQLERAHTMKPDESQISHHLADAYLKANLIQKAQAMYKKAIQTTDDSSQRVEIERKLTAIAEQREGLSSSRAPASAP